LKPGEQVRYCIADAQTAGDFLLSGLQMAGEDVKDYVEIFIPGTMPDRRLMRFSDRYARSMIARLYEGDGAGLGHFRLVYASPDETLLAYHAPRDGGAIIRKATPFADAEEAALWRGALADRRPVVLSDEIVYDGRIGPAVKVFEQVAGARLVGDAAPGVALEAHLDLAARGSGRNGHTFRYVRSGRADANGRFEITVPYPTELAPVSSDVAARAPYEIHSVGPADPGDVVIGRATVATGDVEQGLIVAVTPAR
jgi:asparagine N-glycosylation enzyme membrane subunit Stt3